MSQITAAPTFETHTFEPVGLTVRGTVRDGTPWFVASDVCKALGYSNTSKALSDNVSQTDRMTLTASYGQTGSRGGARSLTVVSKAGLYALILRSKKAEAERFRHWVTSVVLPSLDARGGYILGEEALSETERAALHDECRARLRAMTSRLDDDTWHDSLRPSLIKAEREARAIEHRANQAGIPKDIVARAFSGDLEGATKELVRRTQDRTPGL